MPMFRKKPVVIEAVQWIGGLESYEEVCQLMTGVLADPMGNGRLSIPTLGGDVVASLDDWIIKGTQGEFYPCKPDIFETVYEPVD